MKLRIMESSCGSYAASIAEKIKKELKDMGYNSRRVGVRAKGAGYSDSIRITIKDVSIKEDAIQEIANKYESIRYDDYTGEILSGGNLYILVEYDYDAVKNAYQPYLEEAREIINADSDGSNTVLVMEKGGKQLYYYRGRTGRDGQCFEADDSYRTRVPVRSEYDLAKAMMFFDAQN